jgi:hypothetical protein
MNAMPALLKFLVLFAIFLLASNANAFTSPSPVAGNQVQENQWFQFVEPMRKPTNKPTGEPTDSSQRGLCHGKKSEPESLADEPSIDEEIDHSIAATDSSKNQWQMPTPINFDSSSGLHQSTTMTNQNAHLHSASPQSFLSACVPFSTIHSNLSSGLTSWVQSHAVKVQVSSTPTVSRHAFTSLVFEPVTSTTKVSHCAFTLLAFEPVTSTNQNDSATTALKAIAKIQASPDSNATCNAFGTLAHEHQPLNRTHLIFQLIDASILNTKEMCGASHLAANEHKGLFDSKSLSNIDFQLVVDSKLILHSEGEHTTNPNGSIDRDNLVYFDNHIGFVGPIELVELIGHVGHTNDFVGPSQLVVESKYSKISLHFCKDCRIFCEGEWRKQIIKKEGKAITTSPVTIEKDPANRFPTGSQQVPNRLRTSSVFFDVGTAEKFSCDFP